MRRHRRDLRPHSDMNLTSLLDVTFVLLIAFMIVAPAINQGIPIELPDVSDSEQLDLPENVIRIAIGKPDEKGISEIHMDGSKTDLEELGNSLRIMHESDPKGVILLQGDAEARYGLVSQVEGKIREAGYKNYTREFDKVLEEDM